MIFWDMCLVCKALVISEFGSRGVAFILKSNNFIVLKQKLLCAYLL